MSVLQEEGKDESKQARMLEMKLKLTLECRRSLNTSSLAFRKLS